MDPMLDDSIVFARRLKALNKEVHVEVLEGLPHGFLNFVLVSQDASHGSQVCVDKLKDILQLHNPLDIASFEVLEAEDSPDEIDTSLSSDN